MNILNAAIATILGMYVGRFMALVVHFLPEILFENCDKGREPRDIIIWFFQKRKGGPKYLPVAVAAMFGLTTLFLPFDIPTFFVLTVNCILICCFITDYEHGILPDQFTLFLVWVGLLGSLWPVFTNPHDSIVGALSGYGIFWTFNAIYRSIRGMEGMYPGDFKLNAGIGACFGIKFLIPLMGASLVLLVIVNIIHAVQGNRQDFLFKEAPYACSATVVAGLMSYLLLAGYLS